VERNTKREENKKIKNVSLKICVKPHMSFLKIAWSVECGTLKKKKSNGYGIYTNRIYIGFISHVLT
jgi:hypothetical protein